MTILITAVVVFVVTYVFNILARKRREDIFYDRLGYVIRDAVIDAINESKKND